MRFMRSRMFRGDDMKRIYIILLISFLAPTVLAGEVPASKVQSLEEFRPELKLFVQGLLQRTLATETADILRENGMSESDIETVLLSLFFKSEIFLVDSSRRKLSRHLLTGPFIIDQETNLLVPREGFDHLKINFFHRPQFSGPGLFIVGPG